MGNHADELRTRNLEVSKPSRLTSFLTRSILSRRILGER
jgi:hypothetical protein